MKWKTLKIIQVTDTDVIAQIGRLRAEVWKEFLTPAAMVNGTWTDSYDAVARHWAAFAGGEVVAAARLTMHDALEDCPDWQDLMHFDLKIGLPFAYMGRLAVRKDARTPGLAERFDSLRVAEARQQGAKAVVVAPLHYRISTLLRGGFEYAGVSPLPPEERYYLPSASFETHIMVHRLGHSPVCPPTGSGSNEAARTAGT